MDLSLDQNQASKCLLVMPFVSHGLLENRLAYEDQYQQLFQGRTTQWISISIIYYTISSEKPGEASIDMDFEIFGETMSIDVDFEVVG
mmetsp:Transcript_3494/g.7555  ORF Transcript_3494/g.7555 Transcript_3494/m.7555 type:complete len:88 (-) Transcript_3494:4848-5111(-)